MNKEAIKNENFYLRHEDSVKAKDFYPTQMKYQNISQSKVGICNE